MPPHRPAQEVVSNPLSVPPFTPLIDPGSLPTWPWLVAPESEPVAAESLAPASGADSAPSPPGSWALPSEAADEGAPS